MSKFLIVGSDVHAIRYIETLMFDNTIYMYHENNDSKLISKKYKIELISNNELIYIINSIDLIIITNMFQKNLLNFLKYISHIGYKNKFILEKPLTLSYINAKKIYKILKENRIIVAYTRQFYDDINYTKIDLKQNMIIKWPNFSFLGIDPIKNTLPHIFDLIFKLFSENSDIDIKNIKKENNNYVLYLSTNDIMIKIVLYETNELSKKVEINGIILEWPNYFQVILTMVNKLYDFEYSENKNKLIALKINYLLEKVKESIYE